MASPFMATAMDKFDEDSLEHHFDAPSTFKAVKSLSMQDETSAGKVNDPSQIHHYLTNMQQKENKLNKQEIAKNMEYKVDDIRMGQSLSKVQSLSSMRDAGCTNPMAYTLWHHPTFNEIYQPKREEYVTSGGETTTNHNDHWTIHENWDLFNQLDSTQHSSKSTPILSALTINASRLDEDNNVDDTGDDWNTSSPVFVPLSKSWTGGIATTTTYAMTEDTATTIIDPNNKTTSFGISCPRRHSLPEYISRPIARRPLSTSTTSSSGLQNLIE